ncbi:questin oxidase family protein [Paucibacter sp. DJ1R-11]|uniref:questin oxidase family protein n=1 Tax=Paucibacter sp. DJ1R-11 TaxID=2893556 RepID=UPI0021E46430|nr:questin oxidase family protein [Paucibacter sp. DJ1R-11]MCV2363659.1 questin oxidase family protein [Paucibacter sp. DJ1R-11]
MSSSTVSSSKQLHAWLDRSLAFPPEYGQQLSSHLPMALQALHSLGADEVRIENFFASYTERFEGRRSPSEGRVLPDWQEALGRYEAFADLRHSFAAALAEQGRDVLLRQVLPVLLPGVSAVAFHGAIRTAHALESGHAAELASALAYWACRWHVLPAPAAGTAPVRQPERWSQALVDGAKSWRSEAPLIFLRMEAATQTPLYAELAHGLAPAASLEQRLAELAHLALGYYLDSANFTVLHMITGLRALRLLLPWLPETLRSDPAVQDRLGEAFVAAYMAGRVQPRSAATELDRTEDLSWSELAEAATQARDDHTIKLVHACHEEMAVYGDARYLLAAALVLR